jgi:hypothetical protein
MAYFMVLSQHFPGGGLRKPTTHVNQDSLCPGRYLSPGPPECETRVLITRPHSVALVSYYAKIFVSMSF